MLTAATLALSSVVLSTLLALSGTRTPSSVSPQGCRMAWMSPSYVLQPDLDSTWTPLAGRYSLWLYREIPWDGDCKYCGLPVLFIPGNGGSFRQVRSIASSASRQFYASPNRPNVNMVERGIRPLDFFAVHFNEELTAFHGPTLAAQVTYTSAALRYISSLYPPGTKVIVMGHSMGGIVGVSQLPSHLISVIITMSTPHAVPPARFDERLENVYQKSLGVLMKDETPILSICGGITDLQIPSEFCNLPMESNYPDNPTNSTVGIRKTVYTSALEGCWTGVGHNEMVWCHQVRWRIARAALEVGGVSTKYANNDEMKRAEVGKILDFWFRDALEFPDVPAVNPMSLDLEASSSMNEFLEEGASLQVQKPVAEHVYLLPVPRSKGVTGSLGNYHNFVLYLSRGTIDPVSPSHPLPLSASIYICSRHQSSSTTPVCTPLHPTSLRLIPDPPTDKPFPELMNHSDKSGGGVDESEGVVVFEASVSSVTSNDGDSWVAVWLKNANGGERGWVNGSFETEDVEELQFGKYASVFGTLDVSLKPNKRISRIWIENVLEHALIVYKLRSHFKGNCDNLRASPMLLHTTSPSESHYFRLLPSSTVHLHSHHRGPFIPKIASGPSDLHPSKTGLKLTIYQHDFTDQCSLESVSISIDPWASLGRIGTRYWGAVLAWGGALICGLGWWGWTVWDNGGSMPSPQHMLALYSKRVHIPVAASFLAFFRPLPHDALLGSSDEWAFSLLSPLLVLVSSGMVVAVWYLLRTLLWVYGKILTVIGKTAPSPSRRGSIASLLVMCALVLLVIPWQVEFLACYAIHFHNCSIESLRPVSRTSTASPPAAPSPSPSPPPAATKPKTTRSSAHAQKLFFLLCMTWALPFVLPVVLVWFRTLATAGIFTPFDGDHFILNVLGVMIFTGVVAVGNTNEEGEIFMRKPRLEIIPVPLLYAIAGLIIVFTGPRYTYRTYHALNWPMIALLCFRVIPRFVRRAITPSSTPSRSTTEK